jgi:hypothetical protein
LGGKRRLGHDRLVRRFACSKRRMWDLNLRGLSPPTRFPIPLQTLHARAVGSSEQLRDANGVLGNSSELIRTETRTVGCSRLELQVVGYLSTADRCQGARKGTPQLLGCLGSPIVLGLPPRAAIRTALSLAAHRVRTALRHSWSMAVDCHCLCSRCSAK